MVRWKVLPRGFSDFNMQLLVMGTFFFKLLPLCWTIWNSWIYFWKIFYAISGTPQKNKKCWNLELSLAHLVNMVSGHYCMNSDFGLPKKHYPRSAFSLPMQPLFFSIENKIQFQNFIARFFSMGFPLNFFFFFDLTRVEFFFFFVLQCLPMCFWNSNAIRVPVFVGLLFML